MKFSLLQLREKIARLDTKILADIAERLALAQAIGELKKGQGLPIRDEKWEKAVLERNLQVGEKLGLRPVVIRELTKLIVHEAIALQLSSWGEGGLEGRGNRRSSKKKEPLQGKKKH